MILLSSQSRICGAGLRPAPQILDPIFLAARSAATIFWALKGHNKIYRHNRKLCFQILRPSSL